MFVGRGIWIEIGGSGGGIAGGGVVGEGMIKRDRFTFWML